VAHPNLLWQLVDSTFPMGGFSHSAGLEAAVQLGEIQGSEELLHYFEELLWNVGGAALPFTSAAHASPAALPQLDWRCDAFLSSNVANRASRAQGGAFLRAAAQAFGDPVGRIEDQVRAQALPAHLAPVLGCALASLGMALEDAQRLLLFLALRGAVSAAVRLGVVGPLEAQRLQARAGRTLEEVLAARAHASLEEVSQVTPLLDLLQGHQDRLYSRLFQS